MDYKKIEKGNVKFIDELPPSRPKSTQGQQGGGERPVKKSPRLSLMQILAPILIAGVGIAVIHFMPDRSPSGSQAEGARVGTTQVRQPQAVVRAAPSAAEGDARSPSPGPAAPRRPGPLKKMPPGKAAAARADKAGIGTEKSLNDRAIADAASRDAREMQMSLVSAVVCEGVRDHQPMAEKYAFATADRRRVYVWMEVHSKSQPFVIQHHYYLNGEKHSEVPLNIEHPRMRTWSYVTIDKPGHIGEWRVDIIQNDSVLKTVAFRVSAGAESSEGE